MNIEPENKRIKGPIAFYIILVLLIISVAANIYLFSRSSIPTDEYNHLVEENELLKKQAENRVNKLNETVKQLREKNDVISGELSEAKIELDFYKDNAVFIVNGNDNYHRLECPSLDDEEYWIYNVEAAEDMGYEPCPICFMGKIAQNDYKKSILNELEIS